MIKKWSVAALFLIVIGVVGAFITYSPKEITEEEVMIKEDINSIQLISDNGDIEFIATDDSQITIKDLQSRDDKRRAVLKTKVEDNQLFIEYKQKVQFTIMFGFRAETQRLTVYLPKKQYESLHVKNGNGQVKIEGLNVDNIDTIIANGGIYLEDIQAKNNSVKSTNGEVFVRNTSGDIFGKATNGKIFIETSDLDRNMQLESSNGKILVQTEKEPTNTAFDVQIGNGFVDILGKYSGSAIIGEGENVVKLRAKNGEVTVRQN